MARVRRIAPVAGDLARRQLTRLSATWIAAVLATAVVSACSSAPEPKPLPDPPPSSSAPSSPSASASSSPEQTSAPTLPPEAKGTSAKAAKAFVRYYFTVISFAIKTGDVDHMRQLGADRCKSCTALAASIEKVYAAGGHVESKGWRLTVVSLVPDQPRSRPIFDLSVVQSPEKVLREGGGKVEHFPGGKQPMTITLERDNSRWHVIRLVRVPS
ncbi:MAG TPA: DUF6318 family protein [Nocardioidaceae bacterium]|nr:DUF6318 family protein [Nocardioidaceae bacterium]